jgi:hypothetical protein
MASFPAGPNKKVYLNEGWNPSEHRGALRCYERRASPVPPVGATPDGDLQLGWLRAVAADPRDRPVFLDSRRTSPDGNCALYALLDEDVRIVQTSPLVSGERTNSARLTFQTRIRPTRKVSWCARYVCGGAWG